MAMTPIPVGSGNPMVAQVKGAVSNVMTQRRRHPWLGARSRDEFLSLVSNSAFESSHP